LPGVKRERVWRKGKEGVMEVTEKKIRYRERSEPGTRKNLGVRKRAREQKSERDKSTRIRDSSGHGNVSGRRDEGKDRR